MNPIAWLSVNGGYFVAPVLILLLVFFGWQNKKQGRTTRGNSRHASY